MIRAHVVTVSDGAFHGKREDRSGAAVTAMLEGDQFDVECHETSEGD